MGSRPEQPKDSSVLLWGSIGCVVGVVSLCLVVSLGVYLAYAAYRHWPGVPRNAPPAARPVSEINVEGFPPVPLRLPVPPAPSLRPGDRDLERGDARDLFRSAFQLYEEQKYEDAVRLQYLLVSRTGIGQYNLGCFYARAGDVPAALYWLEVAARQELACPEWALHDSDLVNVRNDDRWPVLLADLEACARRWERITPQETTLVVPQQAVAGEPLPIFVGLPSATDSPRGFVSTELYQALADRMGVAFLGVSGTLGRGRMAYAWSEDPVRDLGRVEAALEAASQRVTPDKGKIVLFGFSQGGAVAGELAARHPDRFAGAILMSPRRLIGSESAPAGGAARDSERPENAPQGVLVVCGADEDREVLQATNDFAHAFEALGSRVHKIIDPPKKTQTLLPEDRERFPEWGAFILNRVAAAPDRGQRPALPAESPAGP